jgi:cyclophilin family peptidyl-prolyl cis-trans isomerase
MLLRLFALTSATVVLVAAQSPDQRALLLKPDAPEFTRPAPERSIVRLETNRGNIDIEVTRAWAPIGADRFINLVRAGYYDGNRFFRVAPGRWVQFGINGDPAVATVWRTRTLRDDPFTQSNVRGTVAFAFAVPNGRTTQIFFICGTTRRRTTRSPSRRSGASSPASNQSITSTRSTARGRAASARGSRIPTLPAATPGC